MKHNIVLGANRLHGLISKFMSFNMFLRRHFVVNFVVLEFSDSSNVPDLNESANF
jgi:hypothetical protein